MDDEADEHRAEDALADLASEFLEALQEAGHRDATKRIVDELVGILPSWEIERLKTEQSL